jgi:Leucine-rich repeat (LRR) protein
VPEVLAKVRTLKIFIASRNSIDKISENLVDMKELLEFDVSDNQILKLPKCMGLWINLQQLFVQSNYLTEFPFELCNLSSLEVPPILQSILSFSAFPCILTPQSGKKRGAYDGMDTYVD